MNILFVSPHFGYMLGGAEINDFNLGSALADQKCDVEYLFVKDRGKEITENAKKINARTIGMRWTYGDSLGDTNFSGKLKRHLFELYFCVRLLLQRPGYFKKFDLVLLTGKPLLSLLKLRVSAKVLQSIRGVPNPKYFSLYGVPDGLIFWGGCENSHDPELLKIIKYVPLSAATEREIFNRDRAKTEGKGKVKTGSEDEIFILSINRLDPIQQIDQIIEVVKSMVDGGYNLKLLVAGDGQCRHDLEVLANELLPGRVKFLGLCSREMIAELLSKSDIFLMNPKFTSYSLSLKEAVLSGTWSIAPDTGTVAGLMKGRSGASIFQPNNIESMEAALRDVLENKSYRICDFTVPEELIDSWDEVARDLLSFYKELL